MTATISEGTVQSETLQGVLTISFFHPLSNSLPRSLLSELADCITEASSDPKNKVILLRSVGERAFCAGASFDELLTLETEKQGSDFFSGFGEVILAIRSCPLLVICRVHGKAVGGGVGLAAAADYVLATRQASIKLSELAIGLGPFVVGPAVERKLGTSAFSSLAIDSPSWRTADWALQNGLYTEVFETTEALDAALHALSLRLANSSEEALKALKRTFWEGTEHWPELLSKRAAISGKLVISEFAQSTISRFKSK